MLRPEETQKGVSQVCFHQLRRPCFPVAQVMGKAVVDSFRAVAAKQFGGCGRRTGACVEQGDAYFPL